MSSISVFISYSHDSDEHRRRVLALSERLRSDGIDTRLDQYVNGTPPEGWPRWMMNQVDDAGFVLVVCTPTYYRRFRGREVEGVGRGADWEGAIITQHIYDSRGTSTKFIPVIFDPCDAVCIPDPLRGRTCYTLSSEAQYQALYDVLLGQAAVPAAPLGPLRRRTRGEAPALVFGAPGEEGGVPRDEGRAPLADAPRADARRWAPRLAAAGALAVLAAAGVAGVTGSDLFPGPPAHSVAVLPLDNNSPDGRFEYLSEGLTEDIITRLASVEGLHVPSPRAVRRYRGASEDIPRIARDLDVAHVLDGSVAREGDRLRIRVQLRDRRDRQVWAQTYDRRYRDVLRVQADIAGQIAEALRTELSAAERGRVAAGSTDRPLAFDLYMRGRAYLYGQVARQVRTDSAIPLFQQALRLDPDYALAYSGLARAYEERSLRVEMRGWYDSAVDIARLAVRKAPGEERTHAALGYILRAGGRHREALRVLRHAATLPPGGESPASGRSNLGLVHQELGRPDSALVWHQRAAEMEPASVMARMRVGLAWEALGEPENAAREYRRAIRVDSTVGEPRYRLAVLLRERGDAAQAEALMTSVRTGQGAYFRFEWEALNGRWTRAAQAWQRWRAGDGEGLRMVPPVLALVYVQAADTPRARAALARAEAVQLDAIDRGDEGYLPRLMLAQVSALRGDVRLANEWFAEAVARGYLLAAEAERLPALAALRPTPEFQARLGWMRARAARLRAGVPSD